MPRAGILPVLRFDDFVLDEANAVLARAGDAGAQRIDLPPKAFDVLCELVRHPGQLVAKDALLDAVWGHRHISESVLKTTIGQIRAALADDARAPRLIETVARRGYRFLPSPEPLQTVAIRTSFPQPTPQSTPQSTPPSTPPSTLPSTPSPGQPLAAAAAPDRSILSTPGATGLVGRRGPLARLAAAWQETLAGRRRLVWVTGEAGIGKTSLLDGFIASLGPEVRVVHGQCVEQIGVGEPYAPVLDALSTLCRLEPGVTELLRAVAPTWRLQLPWLAESGERAQLQRELGGATQGRMLRELAELLERHTARYPLIIVTEDLHWSDHATIQLLDHLARRRTPARLLWLGSCRTADAVASGHPFSSLRHELRLHGLADEIALEPFTEREVADFLAERLPGPPAPESFVRRLHAHTDGLPLFVAATTGELLIGWSAASDLPDAPGHDPVDWTDLALADAPASLTGVLDRAIERLPPERARLLTCAALIGTDFRVRTAADATGVDANEARAAIDALLRQDQWIESRPVVRLDDGSIDEACAFRHSLIRQVFLRRVGAAERVEIHRRIAASLAASRSKGAAISAAELAAHAEAALMPFAAAGHLIEAAGNALAQFAPVEAARHAEAGLALLAQGGGPGGGEARDEAELTLSVQRASAHAALNGLGDPIARASFERASALCDRLPPTAARAWFYSGIGWTWYACGDYPGAQAHAARIAALAEAAGDPVLTVLARNLAGVTACFEGRPRDGLRQLDEGLAAAQGIDEALGAAPLLIDPVVSMHGNAAYARLLTGETEAAWHHLDEAEERSLALGHPFTRMLAVWCRCAVLAEQQDWARLERDQALLDTLVSTLQIGQGRGPVHWFGALLMARRGDPGALARLETGYDCHAGLGMHAGNTAVRCYGARIALALGDPQAAIAQAEAGLALAQRIGEWNFVPQLLVAKAGALALTGVEARARDAILDQARDVAARTGNRWGEAMAGR